MDWLTPIVIGTLVAGIVFVAASRFSAFKIQASYLVIPRRRFTLTAIVFLLASVYSLYPYYTLWRMSTALQTRNADLLASFIDWPTFRENLRSELKAKAAAQTLASEANQNAFGVLGTAIGLALVDNVINSFVTPEMLRAWASKQSRPLSNSPAQSAGSALDTLSAPDTTLVSRVTYAFFTSPTEFRIDVFDPQKQSTVSAFLSFSGLSWKVTRLTLPEEDFTPGNQNSATVSAAPSESAATHLNNGFALLQQGYQDLALTQFDKAIKIDPTNSRAYAGRGDVHRLRGENDLALADLSESVRLDPKNATALSMRGGVYSIMGDNERALADTNSAIAINPNVSMYHNNRGFVHNNRGEYDLAIVDLDEAIRLNSKNAFAYKNRAISFEKKQQLQNALNDYNSALQFKSNLQEAIEGLRRVRQLLSASSRPR